MQGKGYNVNRLSTSISLAAAVGALAGPALAELRYTNDSGGDVLLYGQFNPAYLSFDDGEETTDEFVDSSHSVSRVGLWVTQPFDSNVFTFNFETNLGIRASDSVSQTYTPSFFDWQRTSIRKVDFALKTANAGKFYLGQGSMATDGVADGDFSEAGLAIYNSIGDTAGGFFFRGTDGVLSSVTVGDAYPNFDGGRRGRIRYDTPDFNGFYFSAAAGQEILSETNSDDYYDAALRYSNKFGTTKIQGAIGFSRRAQDNGDDIDQTMGSISFLLDSGLNFAFAAGSQQDGGSYGYGKLGYIANMFQIGRTLVAVDYYDGSDMTSDGSDSTSYSIGAVQEFAEYNVEAYFGYRIYELSEVTTEYQEASSIFFGARWSF